MVLRECEADEEREEENTGGGVTRKERLVGGRNVNIGLVYMEMVKDKMF